MNRSLKSYTNSIIVLILALAFLVESFLFWETWKRTSLKYDETVASNLDYVFLYMDKQLQNYRRSLQFWGIHGLDDTGVKFMMKQSVTRGLLLCDRLGKINWSNLSYAKEGMVLPHSLIRGHWVLSTMLGDDTSPGLIISVPIKEGWLLAEIDSHELLSSIKMAVGSLHSMILTSRDGIVIYSWDKESIWPVGSVIPSDLLNERQTWLDLSSGRIRSFSRPLLGGLHIVAFYNQSDVVRLSAKRASLVASLMLLALGFSIFVFIRGFLLVSSSFTRWVSFLSGASDRLKSTDNSLELADYLSSIEAQVDIIEPHFEEGERLRDAFKELIKTIGIQEESLAAFLEETMAMEESQRETNSQLELAMAQLENILSIASGMTYGGSLQGMAETLSMNLRKTFKCDYAAVIGIRSGVPYLWGDSGGTISRKSMDAVMKLPQDPIFMDEDFIVPVFFMDRFIGYVVIEGCRDYSGYNVADVLHRFALTLGILLHANELLSEVRSSFHYFALRMQAITELYHDETGEHIIRVGEYAAFLSKELGQSEGYIEDIRVYSQLHDIGKMKIDRSLLVKPGKLTDKEMEEVRRHAVYGAELIGNSDWLAMARDICMYHHEKWDGSGYPEGLKGEEIPLAARIVSICDVYDALRGRRCYKKAFSHEKSAEIILRGDGRVMPSHFDPKILQIFKNNEMFFKNIYDSIGGES